MFGEYYYDSRDQSLIIPFRDDLAGLRVSMNDQRSSEVRVWGNYDVAEHRTDIMPSMRVPESRIGSRLSRHTAASSPDRLPLASVSHDSHVVVKLEVLF